jgi:hypothetical protein
VPSTAAARTSFRSAWASASIRQTLCHPDGPLVTLSAARATMLKTVTFPAFRVTSSG